MMFFYAIICHEVTQPLIYTVKELSSCKSNFIIIHVDKKSDIEDFIFLQSENVILFKDRVDIVWGTSSQIDVTHKILRYSLDFKFDYFFLLSGNDIPLKTQGEFQDFININSGSEFFEFQGEGDNYVNPSHRVKYIYPSWYFKRNKNLADKLLAKLYKFLRPLFLRNKVYYKHFNEFPELHKGSNWFGMSNRAVKYTIDYIERNPWYYESFIYSYCCDEVFFHSIIKTWPEAVFFESSEIRSNSLRYIDWDTGPEFPRVLTIEDVGKVLDSGCFFARKFPNSISDSDIALYRKN